MKKSILESTMEERKGQDLVTYEAPFAVQEIKMDNKLNWKITLKLDDHVPQTYQAYTMFMVFNPKKYEDEIKLHTNKIIEIEEKRKKQLIDTSILDSNDCKSAILKIEARRDAAEKKCPTIEFLAYIDSFKYTTDNKTQIVFNFPDSIVAAINKNRENLASYKVRLMPLIIKKG